MDSHLKTGVYYIILLFLLILPTISIAQAQTRTIRGELRDIDPNFPVSSVHVVVVDSDPIIGFVTDFYGQ